MLSVHACFYICSNILFSSIEHCESCFLCNCSFKSSRQFVTVKPWPNDSIFHSLFCATFDLKVERWLSVVELVWPKDSIFRSNFQLLIFPQRISAKNIYHHLYLPANETLLCMISLDFSDKVAKRLDFHSTIVLLLDFLTKIKLHSTSLDSTRLTQQGGQTARFFS